MNNLWLNPNSVMPVSQTFTAQQVHFSFRAFLRVEAGTPEYARAGSSTCPPSSGARTVSGVFPLLILTFTLSFLLSACAPTSTVSRSDSPTPIDTSQPDGIVEAIFLQMNDVYEIQPVGGGRYGGLARVATVLQQLKVENPNAYLVMPGDFFSPSALGTARVEGERLAGKQMVAGLNAIGVDYVTFGNHEFDLNEDQFYNRLEESEFKWISTNVFKADGTSFPDTPTHEVLEITDQDGETMRVAIFGVCLDDNEPDYTSFTDPIDALEKEYKSIAPKADVFVALTHLNLEDDIQLAVRVPELDLIMGGHEHENIFLRRGSDDTPITKVDANARSLYVHRIRLNTGSGKVTIDSDWLIVNESIPLDPVAQKVVDEWTELGFSGFRSQGFEPNEVIAEATEPLDGLEASVRNRSTVLTRLIAESMKRVAGDVDLAIYNGGSIRIDDVVPAGTITQYDVIRMLPFGGEILSLEISGDVLIKLLDGGNAQRGLGGFLHPSENVTFMGDTWRIARIPIDPEATYRIASNDYLASGRQPGLEFFSTEEPTVTQLGEHGDVRQALIDELRQRYPVK